MWQTLFVDMKSMLSWQYLMRDIHIIKTWNITMVTVKTSTQTLKRNPKRSTVKLNGFVCLVFSSRRCVWRSTDWPWGTWSCTTRTFWGTVRTHRCLEPRTGCRWRATTTKPTITTTHWSAPQSKVCTACYVKHHFSYNGYRLFKKKKVFSDQIMFSSDFYFDIHSWLCVWVDCWVHVSGFEPPKAGKSLVCGCVFVHQGLFLFTVTCHFIYSLTQSSWS